MKYLVPSLAQFLIAVIFKYPDFSMQYIQNIQLIIINLIDVNIRMEQT